MPENSGGLFSWLRRLVQPGRALLDRLIIDWGKKVDRECDLVRGYQVIDEMAYQPLKNGADTAVDDSELPDDQKARWRNTRPEHVNA